MPTKKEAIEIYGNDMWQKMVASTWLDVITVTIKRAVCEVKCNNCGNVIEMCIDPYISNPIYWCAHCETGGIGVSGKFIKMEADIPASDIDRAYRAANGEKIHHLEWD